MRTLEDDIKILEECGYTVSLAFDFDGMDDYLPKKYITIYKMLGNNNIKLDMCHTTISLTYPTKRPIFESPLFGRIYSELTKKGIDDNLVRYIKSSERDRKIDNLLK